MNNISPKSTPNAYLIYVNLNEYEGDVNHLREYVAQNRIFERWWSYTPGIFCVRSRSDATQIRDVMLKFLGSAVDLIVALIDPRQTDGRLVIGAWEAFNTDIRDTE